VSANHVQYPAWDFESTIVQSPQLERDLQWFEIDDLGDFTQLNETQNSFLDIHADNSVGFLDMGINDQYSASNETEIPAAKIPMNDAVSENQPSSILLEESMCTQ